MPKTCCMVELTAWAWACWVTGSIRRIMRLKGYVLSYFPNRKLLRDSTRVLWREVLPKWLRGGKGFLNALSQRHHSFWGWPGGLRFRVYKHRTLPHMLKEEEDHVCVWLSWFRAGDPEMWVFTVLELSYPFPGDLQEKDHWVSNEGHSWEQAVNAFNVPGTS